MFLKPGTSVKYCMQKKATMMSENAENICSSLKDELQARCCRLLAKVDFSECEFWKSRNVNSNFQFFSRTKLTTFSLSLSLWKIASPLQLPGGMGGGGKRGVTKGEEGMGGHGHWGNILGAGRQIWICDSYTNVLTMQQIIRINSRDSKLHKNAYIYIQTSVRAGWWSKCFEAFRTKPRLGSGDILRPGRNDSTF